MSEDIAQSETELFDTNSEGTEAATDAASTTQEGEESIKLESSLSDKDKQVLSWEKKILAGERTLDDLKKLPNLKWVLEALEPKLNKKAKVEEKAAELGIEEVMEQKLNEREAKTQDRALFEAKKAELASMKLTKQDATELDRQFKELTALGVPDGKAAEKVALIAKGMVKETPNPRYAPIGGTRLISPTESRSELAELRKLAGR